MAASKQLVLPDPAAVEQAFDCILTGAPPPETLNAEEQADRIIEQIRDAATADDVLNQAKLIKWSDYLDVPVKLLDFHLNPSTLDGKSSVYAVVQIAIVETGEVMLVQTGGRNALAKMVKLWSLGALPVLCKLVEAGKAGPGRSAPLTIVGLDSQEIEVAEAKLAASGDIPF